MGRLAEAAATSAPNRGGVPSTIDVWLDTLDDEDRNDAQAVLADLDRFGHAQVAALILEVHGKRFDNELVRRYRLRRF